MSGGNECVGADEPAHLGVVISGLEVIQLGLSIVDIATVAEGVLLAEGGRKGAAHGKDIAPGIIGIRYDRVAIGTVHQRHYVTLKILDIVIELNGGRTL